MVTLLCIFYQNQLPVTLISYLNVCVVLSFFTIYRLHAFRLDGKGTIKSPNYPNRYPIYATVFWILRAKRGSQSSGFQIRLNFKYFDTEYLRDIVSISSAHCIDGSSKTDCGVSACSYSGSKLSSSTIFWESKGQQMHVTFKSDSLNRNNKGFTADFKTVEIDNVHGNGHIYSPNYPLTYPNNAEVIWNLYAVSGGQSRGLYIRLEFTHFSTESGNDIVKISSAHHVENFQQTNCDISSNCKYSGSLSSSLLTASYWYSKGHQMYLTFTSNGNSARNGFTATFATTAQRLCSPRYFGRDCNRPCNCMVQCYMTTGDCPNRQCVAGKIGGKCQEDCQDGYFGMGCRSSCNCNVPCNKASGICPGNPCVAGKKGATCQEDCTDGYFGTGCSTTCNCKVPCNKVNGTCPGKRCEAGKTGTTCQQDCTDGYFGTGCSTACNCKVPCNKVNGTCPGERCEAGKMGTTCQQDCTDGTFGTRCSTSCNCEAPCNKVTGACPGGQCILGKRGTNCQQAFPFVGIVSGGSVGVVVVLVIGAVIIICLVKRKRQKSNQTQARRSEDNPAFQETTLSSSAKTTGHVSLNDEVPIRRKHDGNTLDQDKKHESQLSNAYEEIRDSFFMHETGPTDGNHYTSLQKDKPLYQNLEQTTSPGASRAIQNKYVDCLIESKDSE